MEFNTELDIKEEPLFEENTSAESEEPHASDVDPFASFIAVECKKKEQLDLDIKIKEEPLSTESEQLPQLQNKKVPFVSNFGVESKSSSSGHQIKDIKIKKELPEAQQSNVAEAETQNVTVPSSSSCVAVESEKDNTDPDIEIKEEPLFQEGKSTYSEVSSSSDTDREKDVSKHLKFCRQVELAAERIAAVKAEVGRTFQILPPLEIQS